MKNSIKDVKALLTKEEKLSAEQLATLKGGCNLCTDPKRCESKRKSQD